MTSHKLESNSGQRQLKPQAQIRLVKTASNNCITNNAVKAAGGYKLTNTTKNYAM